MVIIKIHSQSRTKWNGKIIAGIPFLFSLYQIHWKKSLRTRSNSVRKRSDGGYRLRPLMSALYGAEWKMTEFRTIVLNAALRCRKQSQSGIKKHALRRRACLQMSCKIGMDLIHPRSEECLFIWSKGLIYAKTILYFGLTPIQCDLVLYIVPQATRRTDQRINGWNFGLTSNQ